MGSTCLNAGCIPAKCLLHTAELVSQMNEQGADIGMKVSGVEPVARSQKCNNGLLHLPQW